MQEQQQFKPEHVVTAHEAEQMLGRTLQRLENETLAFRDIQDRAAEAEADYRLAKGTKALAIIRSGLPAKERDARIEVELDPERRAHLAAQAVLFSQRELLLTLRTRVEALRTISASIRGQT